jgi:hypothetical protein
MAVSAATALEKAPSRDWGLVLFPLVGPELAVLLWTPPRKIPWRLSMQMKYEPSSVCSLGEVVERRMAFASWAIRLAADSFYAKCFLVFCLEEVPSAIYAYDISASRNGG